MGKPITFPATFISMTYVCGQNEPSKPNCKLIKAVSIKDLKVQAHIMWDAMTEDDDIDDVGKPKGLFRVLKKGEDYFADFQIADKNGDFSILFTTVKESFMDKQVARDLERNLLRLETKKSEINWVKTTKRRVPPLLKVVVGTYGTHYFLCDRQKWGWESCEKGGKIPAPTMWCDIPVNEVVTKFMRARLSGFR